MDTISSLLSGSFHAVTTPFLFKILQGPSCPRVRPARRIDASVAQKHSLNANLVHKWIRVLTNKTMALQPAFIPVPLPLAGGHSQAASSSICIEIQHPRGTVKVNWPTESAVACATFLRDLLE